MREKFIEAGIPGEKIVTLRHSWDPRLMENQEGEGDYYLFLSRLVPEKGTQSLLNAWNLLEDEMGGACPKLLIGGTGSDENLVRKASENSDKIEFLGFVSGDEKSKLIEKCRAMLAPSVWWEPLGLVTYEAYDNGRPMIAARSGGLSETIEDGVTGFLHEVGSADSLMRCVLQMEERGASARREMGIAGREWLLREASPEKWKSEFQKILLGVSSDK
ncbi:MAG: glycosyltransferase family 4 protein [Roseibacillus sp.]